MLLAIQHSFNISRATLRVHPARPKATGFRWSRRCRSFLPLFTSPLIARQDQVIAGVSFSFSKKCNFCKFLTFLQFLHPNLPRQGLHLTNVFISALWANTRRWNQSKAGRGVAEGRVTNMPSFEITDIFVYFGKIYFETINLIIIQVGVKPTTTITLNILILLHHSNWKLSLLSMQKKCTCTGKVRAASWWIIDARQYEMINGKELDTYHWKLNSFGDGFWSWSLCDTFSSWHFKEAFRDQYLGYTKYIIRTLVY